MQFRPISFSPCRLLFDRVIPRKSWDLDTTLISKVHYQYKQCSRLIRGSLPPLSWSSAFKSAGIHDTEKPLPSLVSLAQLPFPVLLCFATGFPSVRFFSERGTVAEETIAFNRTKAGDVGDAGLSSMEPLKLDAP